MPNSNKKYRSVAMITSALILSLSLGACGNTQSTEKFLTDARQYQQKGDNKAAIIQLKNALQKDPENKDARYLLGAIYNDIGDPLSAEKELRKAVSLGVSPATALPLIAKSLLMQGEFKKMLEETAQDPRAKTDPELISLRGNAYMNLGKIPEMKEAFELALKINPDFPDALVGMATLAMAQQDVAEANRFADLAVSKNPENTQVLMFKAGLLRSQNKADEAMAAYDSIIKLQADNASAYLAKADLEISLKKYPEAQQDITTAKKLSGSPVLTFYSQALLDFSQQKHAAAWESLLQVQRLAPDYLPGILLSGAVQFALGSNKQAEQFLKKYLETNPANMYAQKLLASALLKAGDASAAVAMLEPLLKSKTDDGQLYSLAGESYMQLKDYTKATEYFEKGSALAPKSAEFRTALGMSKLGLGDNSAAIAELEKASTLDAKSSKAGVLLIMTHLRMKQPDKALSAAIAAEKEQPENPLIQNLKGAIYVDKQDQAKARASFEKALALQPTYYPAVANLARLDMQDKKPDMAKKRFVDLLEKDKKNVQVLSALAILAASQNNNEEAKSWLERANTDNPDSASVTQMLALQYVRMGDKEKALVLVKKAQASHPTMPEFMELLAQMKLNMGDQAGALDSYIKLAAMLPESAAAQFKVAATHATMKNTEASIDSLKKTLGLDPKFLDAQLALASLLASKGSMDEALAISRKIQKENDKSALGYVQEGDILMQQKKATAAIALYEKGFKLAKNGQLMIKLHTAYLADGKAKEANLKMVQWLKEHPEDNLARLYFADYSFVAQKNRQAYIEQLQMILKSEPNSAKVLNNLAWAYGEEKDPRALEYAEKAYKLADTSPAIMDTLGWILVEKGDWKRGLPLLQKASSQIPDAMDIRYHLALALLKSGDKEKARKEMEQIVASDKPFAKMDEVKALLKQTSGV
jgi:putative PEP-CTERM system TPR-repeat lipoprotein